MEHPVPDFHADLLCRNAKKPGIYWSGFDIRYPAWPQARKANVKS